MKSARLWIIILLSISNAQAWTGIWNGGGGVLVNGEPVTVGTVMQLPKEGMKAGEIPGLALLIKTVKSLNLSRAQNFAFP